MVSATPRVASMVVQLPPLSATSISPPPPPPPVVPVAEVVFSSTLVSARGLAEPHPSALVGGSSESSSLAQALSMARLQLHDAGDVGEEAVGQEQEVMGQDVESWYGRAVL